MNLIMAMRGSCQKRTMSSLRWHIETCRAGPVARKAYMLGKNLNNGRNGKWALYATYDGGVYKMGETSKRTYMAHVSVHSIICLLHVHEWVHEDVANR